MASCSLRGEWPEEGDGLQAWSVIAYSRRVLEIPSPSPKSLVVSECLLNLYTEMTTPKKSCSAPPSLHPEEVTFVCLAFCTAFGVLIDLHRSPHAACQNEALIVLHPSQPEGAPARDTPPVFEKAQFSSAKRWSSWLSEVQDFLPSEPPCLLPNLSSAQPLETVPFNQALWRTLRFPTY